MTYKELILKFNLVKNDPLPLVHYQLFWTCAVNSDGNFHPPVLLLILKLEEYILICLLITFSFMITSNFNIKFTSWYWSFIQFKKTSKFLSAI